MKKTKIKTKEDYLEMFFKLQDKVLELRKTIGYGLSNEDKAFLELVSELISY